MISSEVQRTLVKSPPELWTELSDPAALARHLGALGEIRITRVEPEHAVEWESEGITGTVMLKPSGWGTKVTLSVTREIAASDEAAPEAEATAEAEAIVEAEPTPEPDAESVAEPAPEPVVEPAPEAELHGPESEIERRRGFLSRLFGGRRRWATARTPAEPRLAPSEALTAIAQALAPERFAAIDPFATPRTVETTPDESESEEPSEPTLDIAAELKAAEEIAAEEVTAVLTSVLDRLGAAHHRPFSRA
jgi:hypothetical protein